MSYEYDYQIGPDVQGTGNIAINTNRRSVGIGFNNKTPDLNKVLYNTNSGLPDKPLPEEPWFEIDDADNVNISYNVQPGGSFKIAWRIFLK